MHVVTGGASNGKAAWVRDFYQLENEKSIHWFNAHKEVQLPESLQDLNGLVVFEGMEQWVLEWMEAKDLDEAREYGRDLIEEWSAWEEQDDDNCLIVICTDISKGIVPMDAKLRKWRDLTGWFYQDLVRKSEQVHVIWYGIARQLK